MGFLGPSPRVTSSPVTRLGDHLGARRTRRSREARKAISALQKRRQWEIVPDGTGSTKDCFGCLPQHTPVLHGLLSLLVLPGYKEQCEANSTGRPVALTIALALLVSPRLTLSPGRPASPTPPARPGSPGMPGFPGSPARPGGPGGPLSPRACPGGP